VILKLKNKGKASNYFLHTFFRVQLRKPILEAKKPGKWPQIFIAVVVSSPV
jgi:hypothetical protein